MIDKKTGQTLNLSVKLVNTRY